jgi:hypothetical protein
MVSSIQPAATSCGVAIAACGVRPLTAIPWPSHSLAAVTVRRLSAALDAPYWKPLLAGLFVGNGGPGGKVGHARTAGLFPPRD